MRLLLTGSSVWLGRFLAPALRRAGHSVTGLDVVPSSETVVVGSVADQSLIECVFGDHGIEAVVHAGALHKPDIARFSAQAFIDTNVTGTLNLLQAAARAGHDRFVFTSTTSLMISRAIREERGAGAVWLDESSGPLEPRNIYGVTKLAAEGLCRLFHVEHGLNCIVLRTSRFFPEEDDTPQGPLSGPNIKANEFLHRRLTVEDAFAAHLTALDSAPRLGFGVFVVSAPTPFTPSDVVALKADALSVIERYFPDAPGLYAERGWRLPTTIGRVYDSSKAQRVMGFRCTTDFARILDALRGGHDLPFAHDPHYVSPTQILAAGSP
jgi:nucleoside-diphosphate-sugar epimerase